MNNPNLSIANCCQSATTTYTRAYKHIRKYKKIKIMNNPNIFIAYCYQSAATAYT